MNNLAEVKDKIQNLWDLDEISESNFKDELKVYIESKDAKEIAKEIRENFEQNMDSGIDFIYEVISDYPEKFSDFIIEEYKRGYIAAETSKNPKQIFDALDSFCYIDEIPEKLGKVLIDLTYDNLFSKNDLIKYASITLVLDWLMEDQFDNYPHVIRRIIELLSDKNWRIRYCAYQTLSDIEKLPKGLKLSILDRIRAKVFNPYL